MVWVPPPTGKRGRQPQYGDAGGSARGLLNQSLGHCLPDRRDIMKMCFDRPSGACAIARLDHAKLSWLS